MNKINLIIQREYLVRIRKRTFWILTFLGPVLYASIFALPVIIQNNVNQEKQVIYVLDESKLFDSLLKADENMKFVFIENKQLSQVKTWVVEDASSHILMIKKFDLDKPDGFELMSNKNAGLRINMLLTSMLNNAIKDMRINKLGIDPGIIETLEPNVRIDVRKISETGIKRDNTQVASIISGLAAFLNYLFIFIYGSLILRGVQEEKSSRIIEVIASSVRPFQLMLGKIIGVALVGLTQFILWILLTALISFILFSAGGDILSQLTSTASPGGNQFGDVMSMISGINLPLILLMFVFYFITGYLLYAAMFAAVAAAVDNQTDMQQFMLPISIPLIFSIILIPTVIDSPNSALAVWLSMIPFTSPVVMMARIAFGVSEIQLVASMILMIAGFLSVTWLAAKVYRIGILSYGNKVTYKDMYKWIFYK